MGHAMFTTLSGTPFYFLDPAFAATGGGQWWRRRLRHVIDAVGIDAVASRFMCIEHFPYKSARYRPLGVTLPSQQYTFDLVRRAMAAHKPIIIMRSERIWLRSTSSRSRATVYRSARSKRLIIAGQIFVTLNVISTLAAAAAGGSLTFGGVPFSPGSTVQANVPLSALEKSYAGQGGNPVPANAVAVLATPANFDPTKSWPILIPCSQAILNVRTEMI